MRTWPGWMIVVALCAIFPSCDSATVHISSGPGLHVRVVVSSDLPDLDERRTFEYRFPEIEDPEGLLRVLADEGIPVSRAWLPMDNRCADPAGPRFTVELTRDDPRILEHAFDRGTGRLHCATTLTAYTISSP